MSTRSKVIVIGFALAIAGATAQWGLGAGLCICGSLMFIGAGLDDIAERTK